MLAVRITREDRPREMDGPLSRSIVRLFRLNYRLLWAIHLRRSQLHRLLIAHAHRTDLIGEAVAHP